MSKRPEKLQIIIRRCSMLLIMRQLLRYTLQPTMFMVWKIQKLEKVSNEH